MDVLSDVLNTVRLTGALYFDIDAGTPWVGESPSTSEIAAKVMPGAEHVIGFHMILSGDCWAAVDDGSVPPEHLGAGDIVVFPHGQANVLSSSLGARDRPNLAMYYRPTDGNLPFRLIHGGDGGDRTRFVCGYLGCDAHPFNPLLSSLPALLRSRPPADGNGWIGEMLQIALAEGNSHRDGVEIILAKLSELMFVEILRRYLEDMPADARGWLSGLRDPQVGAALRLIHGRPAEPWTLELLARETGLSRSRFSSRFSQFVHMAPMHYLTRWRMQLAVRRLAEPSASIAQIAAEVGYESEAAFKRSFKKVVGIPPGAWRRTHTSVAAAV